MENPLINLLHGQSKRKAQTKARHLTNTIYRIVPRIGSPSDLAQALYRNRVLYVELFGC